MSIITKSVVECILKGQGHTDEQVKQLARAWLTMPSVQPMHEQNARFAIDGAIAFGKAGINKPDANDHWLMPYWQMGRLLAQPAVHEPTPENWKRALHAAVSAIYFDDSSDYRSALGTVVRFLDEKLAGDLLTAPRSAYDAAEAMVEELDAKEGSK